MITSFIFTKLTRRLYNTCMSERNGDHPPEHTDHETLHDMPLDPELIQEASWVERFKRYMKRPLGRRLTSVTLATYMLLGEGEPVSGPVMVKEVKPADPSVELTIGDRTDLTFVDWRNLEVNEDLPLITPDDELKSITLAEVELLQDHLLPIEVQDPGVFEDWVGQQAERPDILGAAGITDVDSASAHQLVDVAVGIAVANLSYMDHDDVGENLENITRVYDTPVDTLLINQIPMQCEGYSVATAAIFNEMKKVYPEALQNTYIVTHTSEGAGHVWNMVVHVEGPHEAEAAFLDATAADPEPGDFAGTEIDLGYPEFIEGLEKKGTIDKQMFYSLALQHEEAGNMTNDELFRVLTYDSFGVATIDPHQPDASFIQLGEQYLDRYSEKSNGNNPTISQDEWSGVSFVGSELYDYYTNPDAEKRPEDWHERALRAAESIATASTAMYGPSQNRE